MVGERAIVLQELIPGSGSAQFSYAAVWHRGAPVASLVARRTRQYPVEFGYTSTFVETVEQSEVEDAACRFLRSLDYSGLVEVLARERALLVEILTAVVKLLLSFQRYLRRLRIPLRLLDLFRQSGGGRDRIRGLRLVVRSLIVLSSGSQVAILQGREQLPGMNLAAAIDIERFNRRADLRNNRRLGLRV